MATIHISEADLERDVAGVLAKVRQGAEIVVESENEAVAVIRPAKPPRRTLSDLIRLAAEREKARGYAITLDPEFAEAVTKKTAW